LFSRALGGLKDEARHGQKTKKFWEIFCKFLKTPYLTRRIWGKTGVPNKVNDTVAPWGLILQQFCVCKKCRSSLDLLRKKNLAQAVRVVFALFLRHVVP
jgi:hypothetical protein